MPYRRLPNTDNARLRALKKAIEMAEKIPSHELAFSFQTHQKLKSIAPYFEQMLLQQKQAMAIQAAKSKELAALAKKARMYISHFYQVLNFAIMRNEIPASARKFFGLKENDCKIPNLLTDKDIVYWGEQLIKGEKERLTKMGGNPITNPTAAVVKVRYDQYLEALYQQKIYQKSTRYATDKIAELRANVDSLILELWNEVEQHFSHLDEEAKRNASIEYGVVYVWRPYERENSQDDEFATEQEIFESISNNRANIDTYEEENQLQYAISFSGN
ncbi:MAG: hypothetical protein N2449_07285 [Bacteroidales bacterium]|nr:hypothetical protein [Bacteroidales bacterium]